MKIGGINTEKLKLLTKDIQEYIEKIQNNLQESFDLLESTKQSYKGSNQEEFFQKVENLKASKETISTNLYSYIDDYNQIIEKYKNEDQEIVQSISYNLLEQTEEER